MEIIIIKLFFNYNLFNTYYNSIDLDFIKSSSKQLERLCICLEEFHKKYPEKGVQSADELAVFYFSLYPASNQKDREMMEPLFRKLEATTVTNEVAEEMLQSQRRRAAAAKMSMLGLQIAEGQKDFSLLIEESKNLEKVGEMDSDYQFVIDDPSEGRPPQGIRWRLDTLNRMIGSLRKGNFGFIFARPETGKTTFLADLATFCSTQELEQVVKGSSGNILWFNNEQPGMEVLHRCMQSYFGITSNEFYSKKQEYNRRYYEETQGRIKIVDEAALSKKQVESICRRFNPSLIIFDQIDKIRGFSDDRNDLELKAIYQWARELSKEYGPVIGVCQAGGSGEGIKYLRMDDVDSSKTAKQGEADWILGIGKSHSEGMESIRHLHLCKNKLIGDEDTDPSLRHGKADIIIKADIARYEDLKR